MLRLGKLFLSSFHAVHCIIVWVRRERKWIKWQLRMPFFHRSYISPVRVLVLSIILAKYSIWRSHIVVFESFFKFVFFFRPRSKKSHSCTIGLLKNIRTMCYKIHLLLIDNCTLFVVWSTILCGFLGIGSNSTLKMSYFAFLCVVDYLKSCIYRLPRVWGYLNFTLSSFLGE